MKTFANSVSILLLGGSLVALLLVNFAMLLGIGSINDASGGFFIGILFSQAALIAVLMAWAPLPLGVRMVLGISILIWCVVCLAAAFVHADVPTESLWMAILPAAVWIANCIPLVYMRLTMGTRISCNEEVPGYEGQ